MAFLVFKIESQKENLTFNFILFESIYFKFSVHFSWFLMLKAHNNLFYSYIFS